MLVQLADQVLVPPETVTVDGADGVDVESVRDSPVKAVGTAKIEFVEFDKVVPLEFIAVTVAVIDCPESADTIV